LLVGGKDYFPVRISNIEVIDEGQSYECQFVSDLYYADIYDEELNFSSWDSNGNDIFGEYKWGSPAKTDDVDLYPDVHLGRLACTNSGQVSSCVNKIIDYEVNEAYKLDGSITLGEMWTNALTRYISSNIDSDDYFTVEEWLLMGDPTLSTAKDSTPPNKPIISGPASGKAGDELIITASATDIDGDKFYYLFDW